jgi:hypothetical protein
VKEGFVSSPKIRIDSTIVCRDPTRSVEVKKLFEVLEGTNLRRNNSFAHKAIVERRRKSRNPLRFQSRKIS